VDITTTQQLTSNNFLLLFATWLPSKAAGLYRSCVRMLYGIWWKTHTLIITRTCCCTSIISTKQDHGSESQRSGRVPPSTIFGKKNIRKW